MFLGIGQHGEKKIAYQKAKGENTALQGREFIFCGFSHHRGKEKGDAAQKGQEENYIYDSLPSLAVFQMRKGGDSLPARTIFQESKAM